jgi:hypothetical protein
LVTRAAAGADWRAGVAARLVWRVVLVERVVVAARSARGAGAVSGAGPGGGAGWTIGDAGAIWTTRGAGAGAGAAVTAIGGGVTVWGAGASCANAGVDKNAAPINSAARGRMGAFFIISQVQ